MASRPADVAHSGGCCLPAHWQAEATGAGVVAAHCEALQQGRGSAGEEGESGAVCTEAFVAALHQHYEGIW